MPPTPIHTKDLLLKVNPLFETRAVISKKVMTNLNPATASDGKKSTK